MNALLGKRGAGLAIFPGSGRLLLTRRGRCNDEVFGLRGNDPWAVDCACNLLCRSSNNSAPVVGCSCGCGRVKDLTRYSLSGDTSSCGELLGEFSMVEGGATPSPHLGGREGGLRRRVRPPALRSTIFTKTSSLSKTPLSDLKEGLVHRRGWITNKPVATLARRDSLTLTAFNPLHSDNAIDSICFDQNNITINTFFSFSL